MTGDADDPVVRELLQAGMDRLERFRVAMGELAELDRPASDLIDLASRKVLRTRLGAEESRSRLLARGLELQAKDHLAGLVQVDACKEVVEQELGWCDLLEGAMEAFRSLLAAAEGGGDAARSEVDAYLRQTLRTMAVRSTS